MNIIIAAGGTGGHVFPAVCIAKKLKKKSINVRFATDNRGLRYLSEFKDNAIIQQINTSSRAKLYFSLVINIISALFFLLKNKCDCVIGFGGYPSVPYVLAAQILRKKTIIHEQNAVIGKANKLLSNFANKILTSFENTKNLANSEKIINVGMPTRFEEKYENINFEKGQKFTILIFGGSQGAKIFSESIAKVVCSLGIKDIFVYNQVPEGYKESTENIYKKANMECIVDSFFDNIDELYQKADLVISRSGSSSIFEIIGFRKPSILIPYKKSINGDQEENAKILWDKKAAIVFDENEINLKMKSVLLELINNSEKLEVLKKNIESLYKSNITEKFLEEILKILK